MLSQTSELKKVIFRVAETAVQGVHYYKNKIRNFEGLIQSSDVKYEDSHLVRFTGEGKKVSRTN